MNYRIFSAASLIVRVMPESCQCSFSGIEKIVVIAIVVVVEQAAFSSQ